MRFLNLYVLSLLFIATINVFGQTIEQKVWYESDPPKVKLKAVYHVNDQDPAVLDGEFMSFYENGKKSTWGAFFLGERLGVWTYFFEHGEVHMIAKMTSQEFF